MLLVNVQCRAQKGSGLVPYNLHSGVQDSALSVKSAATLQTPCSVSYLHKPDLVAKSSATNATPHKWNKIYSLTAHSMQAQHGITENNITLHWMLIAGAPAAVTSAVQRKECLTHAAMSSMHLGMQCVSDSVIYRAMVH